MAFCCRPPPHSFSLLFNHVITFFYTPHNTIWPLRSTLFPKDNLLGALQVDPWTTGVNYMGPLTSGIFFFSINTIHPLHPCISHVRIQPLRWKTVFLHSFLYLSNSYSQLQIENTVLAQRLIEPQMWRAKVEPKLMGRFSTAPGSCYWPSRVSGVNCI